MTLTEQWKNGELEEGYYYVKSDWSDGVDIRYVHNGVDDWREITSPVPSYEEYSRLEWYAGCGPDRIVELNKENRQLRKWCEEFNALEVAKENQQLKKLLKECRCFFAEGTECDLVSYPKNDLFMMLEKIDNAIGEKK